ncbi:aldehyde dehydrogenase family protein, partial [Novosphingobium naphthalenivorans]|uniref:aldehyde dehydrogenase family protein n=1 Tax=Novosphingobium naphthalenivorans TaxID=273168 RepID=UPI000A9C5FB7
MKPVTTASHMLIGGDLVASESGDWIDSIDPATEEVIGRIPNGDARDVARAVEAADRAW